MTRKMKKTLSTILAVILIVGAVGAVAAFATNDSKPAGAMFKVGGLNPTTGKYVDTDKSIYTEKAFDCFGLRVEPDFESTVTYDIYYYDDDEKLLRVVEGLTEVYSEKFELAAKCRILIHPEIPDDVKEKDFKVSIFDVAKYASMLNITVSKEASTLDFTNLYDEEFMMYGQSIVTSEGTINKATDYRADAKSKVSPLVEIDKGEDTLEVWVKHELPPPVSTFVVFFDGDGNYINHHQEDIKSFDDSGWKKYSFEIPEDAEGVVFILPTDGNVYAFYR